VKRVGNALSTASSRLKITKEIRTGRERKKVGVFGALFGVDGCFRHHRQRSVVFVDGLWESKKVEWGGREEEDSDWR